MKTFFVLGLEDTVKLVKGIGGKCYGYVVDLASREDIYRVAKKVEDEVGRVCNDTTYETHLLDKKHKKNIILTARMKVTDIQLSTRYLQKIKSNLIHKYFCKILKGQYFNYFNNIKMPLTLPPFHCMALKRSYFKINIFLNTMRPFKTSILFTLYMTSAVLLRYFKF